VVEDAPPIPPPPPRSVVRAKLVKPRAKPRPAAYRNPIVLGGAALAAACVSVIVAAVIVRSGGDPPATPAPPRTHTSDRIPDKAPRGKPPGERAPKPPGR
jgi:protein TonB